MKLFRGIRVYLTDFAGLIFGVKKYTGVELVFIYGFLAFILTALYLVRGNI